MRYCLIIVLLSLNFNSFGCDICGCQLGGYSFGILAQNPTHFIGLRYSHAQFRAEIDNSILEDEFSNDTYQTVELMGRYVFSKKWQVSAILPYSYNQMNGNLQSIEVSGIGDPILIGYYNLLNTSYENFRIVNHSVMLGGGIKFPLGDFDAVENDEIINRNFQLGSGSLDFLFSMIYTIKYKSWGMNIESSYKVNTINKYDYQFGNQFTSNSKLFYALIQPSYSLLPYVGLNYEYSGMHEDNGFMQVNTGGKALLTTVGLQAYIGSVMIMANVDVPVMQDYNTDARSVIESKLRFGLGVVLNIKSKSGSEVMLMNEAKN
ncbi:MAG: transporter [Reichenbachiella sp.]